MTDARAPQTLAQLLREADTECAQMGVEAYSARTEWAETMADWLEARGVTVGSRLPAPPDTPRYSPALLAQLETALTAWRYSGNEQRKAREAVDGIVYAAEKVIEHGRALLDGGGPTP